MEDPPGKYRTIRRIHPFSRRIYLVICRFHMYTSIVTHDIRHLHAFPIYKAGSSHTRIY